MSVDEWRARRTCGCVEVHEPRRIVLTGGPGAGKTAVLEMARASLCQHVQILPESASLLFGGGFPRGESAAERQASQRAIFHVQRELEAVADAHDAAIVLCDRGTLDGLAYWPGDPADLWREVHSDPVSEMRRYDAVLDLRTPASGAGYDHSNLQRTETAAAAAVIDARIAEIWSSHSRMTTIAATADFMAKAQAVLDALSVELPECCRRHLGRPRARQQVWLGSQPE